MVSDAGAEFDPEWWTIVASAVIASKSIATTIRHVTAAAMVLPIEY